MYEREALPSSVVLLAGKCLQCCRRRGGARRYCDDFPKLEIVAPGD